MNVKINDLRKLLEIYTEMYYESKQDKAKKERALQMREAVKLYITTREAVQMSHKIHIQYLFTK